MQNASVAEMIRRVERMLRIMELLNRMYSSRTAVEIDWCERQLDAITKEPGK